MFAVAQFSVAEMKVIDWFTRGEMRMRGFRPSKQSRWIKASLGGSLFTVYPLEDANPVARGTEEDSLFGFTADWIPNDAVDGLMYSDTPF